MVATWSTNAMSCCKATAQSNVLTSAVRRYKLRGHVVKLVKKTTSPPIYWELKSSLLHSYTSMVPMPSTFPAFRRTCKSSRPVRGDRGGMIHPIPSPPLSGRRYGGRISDNRAPCGHTVGHAVAYPCWERLAAWNGVVFRTGTYGDIADKREYSYRIITVTTTFFH
jgi:hypothetical protein